MNYETACDVLEIERCGGGPPLIPVHIIRKQYLIQALRYHPDKNPSFVEEANERFQMAKNAYDFLMAESSLDGHDDHDHDHDDDEQTPPPPAPPPLFSSSSYGHFVSLFLQHVSNNKVAQELIHTIAHGCCSQILDFIRQSPEIEVSTLIFLARVLRQHGCVFMTSSHLLFVDALEQIIQERMFVFRPGPGPGPGPISAPVEPPPILFKPTVILNPSLHDLISANIYRLRAPSTSSTEEMYAVPLWHHELEYDDLIVRCVPDLPSNVSIDEENHIHISLKIDIRDLSNLVRILDNEYYAFFLDDRLVSFASSKLRWVRHQTLSVSKLYPLHTALCSSSPPIFGCPQSFLSLNTANTNHNQDIYEISRRGKFILHIEFVT
jgi:hypothetical protein